VPVSAIVTGIASVPRGFAARMAALCAALLLAVLPAFAQQLVAVPALSSPVTDLTGTLSSDQVASLDAKLRAFEQQKGSQVAVLIVQPRSRR